MPQTCLIAAHDPWFIQLLRVYSEESGFRVVQAFECQDVLPLVYRENPAAVLLQMDLPGQGRRGDLLESLQKDPATGHIPLLVFSWQSSEAADNVPGGVTAFLQEPVTYEAFVDALRKAGLCT